MARAAQERPNIIIILSDDMGYSDIGCYGGEIQTPQLDALAADGLRFTQFYNTARCCPTRASLLTGLYPHQAGIGHMTDDRGRDGYRGDLNTNCVTIAQVLQPAGYRCFMAGKWHVTKHLQAATDAEKLNWPCQRGFDRFYGTIIGGGSYWDPAFLTRDNTQISPFADPDYQPKDGYYYTDALSDHAVRFVREHRTREPQRPFFLYLAYTAAHWPMHAREADVEKYRGKYAVGYQATRDARYRRMAGLGVIDRESTAALPIPKAARAAKHRAWDERNMEVYAAMVDRMDQGIAKLVETLKETGALANTLLFYLQDNGGCAEGMGRGKQGAERLAAPSLPPLPPTELQRKLIPSQTRDGYPVRQGKGVMAGGPDTYIGYGEAWAAVSNTPFREYKHWTHEGGISTPLIIHWPAGIPSDRRGTLDKQPGHLIDLMATCVDVSGAAYPKERKGQAIKPMEGTSLRPAFSGGQIPRSQPLFWEHEGNRAVRDGKWKLVAKANQPWELYDIDADRTEQHDLASAKPELAVELAKKWDDYAARASVLPLGAWKQAPTPLPEKH
ncbi:MAG: arylsulfatase [Verrucomicrobiales bacterium]|nr:arylsulfatase [Verrucomicrobiales bacterium]